MTGTPVIESASTNAKYGQKTGVAFEDYLSSWADYIWRQQKQVRKLVEMSVTIHRRARGLTISDQYGGYGTRTTTQGQWLDYDPDQDGGPVHPINIVNQAISTNKNACLQSNVAIEVNSRNASAKHKQIALRWQRVADYLDMETWDEATRNFIFDATQKDGTLLVRSYPKEKSSQSVPQVGQSNLGLAVYHCPECKAPGITQAEMPEESEGMAEMQVPCTKCGTPVDAVAKSISSLSLNEGEVPVYDIETELIPFYNFTIDTYGAKIKGIQGAKWLQVQKLTDRMELETRYPHMQFAGAQNWCYPLRCDYALASADWSYLNGWGINRGTWEFDRMEERSIHLHEDAYSNYRAPADYEFINAKGKRTFTIKKDQSIKDAWNALYPDQDITGFKFVWSDERVLEVCDPEVEEVDFRKTFSDVHWSRESGTYLSSPFYSIVTIQDDITLLNTLHTNIVSRNAWNPVYYNSLIFDKADFAQEYIGSKNAALGPDGDIQKTAMQLPVATPSPHLQTQLTFLWEIKDSVTAVTPAMRGEQQRDTPYAAQRQQLEQSYGNLTSVLKSFAQCKTSTFKQQANLCKQRWTLEQFQRVGSMFGEPWGEEEVEEMCAIDFDQDLRISYRSGSEMPQSNLSKEMKFFGALQQLMPFVEAFPQLLGSDKLTQILQKIDEYGDFDFDLTGLEVNELLAQKRFMELAEICQQYASVTLDQLDQMRQQVVALEPPKPEAIAQAQQLAQTGDAQAQALMKPTPITALDLLTEQIFHQSEIRFSPYEDLDQQKSFFVEALRGEQGKTNVNVVLVEMLTTLLGMLDQALQQKQQEAMQNDPQVAMAREQAANEKEEADADRQVDIAKIQSDDMNQAADRELEEREMKATIAVDLMKVGAEQEHDMSKTVIQGKIQKEVQAAKPMPKPPKKK